jgi:muramidase (phage lysozyme)
MIQYNPMTTQTKTVADRILDILGGLEYLKTAYSVGVAAPGNGSVTLYGYHTTNVVKISMNADGSFDLTKTASGRSMMTSATWTDIPKASLTKAFARMCYNAVL